jgi:hypothetical protein
MRWTRDAIATEATRLDEYAAAKLEGAADCDQAATDPSLSDRERQVNASAASTLRGQASDMQGFAAALRDGVSPEELGYAG